MSKTISLKKNVIFNTSGQIYTTLIALIMLPLYIKYMGAEAYGLIGFFSIIQSIFAILDFGMSPTISRQTANFKGGGSTPLEFRQLYRSLSFIFMGIAVVVGVILYFNSDIIANKWLNANSLDINEIIIALKVMVFIIVFRWMTGLFKGVIIGSEEIVWLSIINIVISSFRFIGVFCFMYFYGFSVYNFFIFQLVVGLSEFIVLFFKSRVLLPICDIEKIGWSISPIKKVLKFSIMIAFTSIVWILITQSDKLILSGILPLSEYGYFTLAVLVASGIMAISAPITGALVPRMTKLYAENNLDGMIDIYKKTTEVIVIISGSISFMLIFFSENILFVWTGDRNIAEVSSPILTLYATGNFFLSFGAFPGYIQQAYGNLKYHFIGNIIILVTVVPLSIIMAYYYGAVGAGYVWMSMNFLFFIFWVWYSHTKLVRGLHFRWLYENIIKVSIIPLIFILLIKYNIPIDGTKNEQLLFLISIGIFIFVTFLTSSSFVKTIILNKIKDKNVV